MKTRHSTSMLNAQAFLGITMGITCVAGAAIAAVTFWLAIPAAVIAIMGWNVSMHDAFPYAFAAQVVSILVGLSCCMGLGWLLEGGRV